MPMRWLTMKPCLEVFVVRVAARGDLEALGGEGLDDGALGLGLSRPADLVGRLTQIAAGDEEDFAGDGWGGGFDLRDGIGGHFYSLFPPPLVPMKRFQNSITRLCGGPSVAGTRGVGDALERLSDGSAAGCDAGQRAGGDRLQHDIAESGGLHRPADYITSAGVGCHLAEILIHAAAADDAEGCQCRGR